MADQPDGPDGVEEPSLPFGTSVVDDSDDGVDASAGEPAEDEMLAVDEADESGLETPDARLEPDADDAPDALQVDRDSAFGALLRIEAA